MNRIHDIHHLAAAYALDALGKHVRIINVDSAPEHYFELPGLDRIEIADEVPATMEADAVIGLAQEDFPAGPRFQDAVLVFMPEVLRDTAAPGDDPDHVTAEDEAVHAAQQPADPPAQPQAYAQPGQQTNGPRGLGGAKPWPP